MSASRTLIRVFMINVLFLSQVIRERNKNEDSAMQCQKKYLRVDRRYIGFMKFIFEAYEGIANLTTIDPKLGIISVNIPDGCMDIVNKLLKSLGRDILIEPLEERG